MRILTAACTGYIGSHTPKAFAEAGRATVVHDGLRTEFIWAFEWGPLERSDLVNTAVLAGAIP